MISLVAAVGKNGELGAKNQLLFRLKMDAQFFKALTYGKTVIMGSNTFKGIGHPLTGRTNIVLTTKPCEETQVSGVSYATLTTGFFELLAASPIEFIVIGGAIVYSQFLPYATTIYLTEIDSDAEADTFFPDFDREAFDKDPLAVGHEDGIPFKIVKYTRRGTQWKK